MGFCECENVSCYTLDQLFISKLDEHLLSVKISLPQDYSR